MPTESYDEHRTIAVLIMLLLKSHANDSWTASEMQLKLDVSYFWDYGMQPTKVKDGNRLLPWAWVTKIDALPALLRVTWVYLWNQSTVQQTEKRGASSRAAPYTSKLHSAGDGHESECVVMEFRSNWRVTKYGYLDILDIGVEIPVYFFIPTCCFWRKVIW